MLAHNYLPPARVCNTDSHRNLRRLLSHTCRLLLLRMSGKPILPCIMRSVTGAPASLSPKQGLLCLYRIVIPLPTAKAHAPVEVSSPPLLCRGWPTPRFSFTLSMP